MGISGQGGSVGLDSNGYDEPPRTTGNRMNTDYAQDPEVKQTRRSAFDDGSKSS